MDRDTERAQLDAMRRLQARAAAPDPSTFGADARKHALDAYDAGDWHGIYSWTKSWISNGGGAWLVDAWLLYVISAILHGQPRNAVHSTDLALQTWIEAPQDHAILLFVRAVLIHRLLKDPKTALSDYDAARRDAPDWLRDQLEPYADGCERDAAKSRRRKPIVGPAPALTHRDRGFVQEPLEQLEPGAKPTVWSKLMSTVGGG